MQFLGDTSDFGWIINIAFLVFIIVFSLYGQKFQLHMWLRQIESALIELRIMMINSKEKALEVIKKYSAEGVDPKEKFEKFLEFFTIEPVDKDPAGVLDRLEHIIEIRKSRFEEFINEIAPKADEVTKSNLENTVEVAMVLNLIFRIVRHYWILGKKTGSTLIIMQLQMQLADIMRLAKSYAKAIDPFSKGKPIGDSIGPLSVTTFAKKHNASEYHDNFEKEIGYYEVNFEDRTIYVIRATGPGGRVGKPGFAIKKLINLHKNEIRRIITVDAALKLEGEKTGTIVEGVGAAIGDPGPEKYAIEQTATENNIPLDAIVCKQSEGEAVGTMNKQILDTVDEIVKTIEEAILKRTNPGDHIILAGIGNTIGVGI